MRTFIKSFIMKMIRYIIALVLLSIAAGAQAQLSLYVDSHAFDSIANRSYELNNNNAINTPTVQLAITNQTGTAFSDSIYFGYTVTGGGTTRAYTSDTTVSSGVYYPVSLATLPPQGSATVGTLIFHFTSPVFVVGSSLVVIWPIVKGHNAQVDSVTIAFDITAPNGIAGINQSGRMVYMSGTDLVVRQEENAIGSIRIFDLMGQLVATKDVQGNTRIPMSPYAEGIYTVEVLTTQGDRQVYKVLKQ